MSLRYSDINVSYEIPPDVWTYNQWDSQKGIPFQVVWELIKNFERRKEEVKNSLIETISEPINLALSDKEIGEGLDPIFDRLHKSFFFGDGINEKLLLQKANRNTLNKKLQSWCAQLNENIPVVQSNPGVHVFKDTLKGVPCVIVCAGPSLANNIDLVKGLDGKAVIMAVDTSLRSLVKRDVKVNFVNAHDANPQGAKFFKGIKTEAIGLFVNYISPITIKAFEGKKCFYYVRDDSIATYKTMAIACNSKDRKDNSFLDADIIGGSSVAHTALYIALMMGCNPVTFIGLDLCYPDINNSHFESDNPKKLNTQKLMDVVNIQGKKVKTNLSFYSYKTVLENMVPAVMAMYNAEIFTSTEDDKGKVTGIVHCGLEPKTFQDFINKYCQETRQEIKAIQEVYSSYGKYAKK